jgi:diguanylate cyclase (GGDEF)-like protein
MVDTSNSASEIDSRVAAYAAWVRDLRGGKQVLPLHLDAPDPLARLGRELQLLSDTISRREEELRRLFDVIQSVELGVSVENVLDRVFSGFVGLIPYERIGCAFLSEDLSDVTAYWAKSTLGEVRLVAGYSQAVAGSSLEKILRSGQPRIINDLQAYLESKPNSDSTRRIVLEGGRSNLTFPLIVQGRPIGFLFFTSKHVGAYKDLHQATFRQIASQVSIVIEKSRLYSDLIERNKGLARESQKFERAASRDALTNILNRGAIVRVLEQALVDASQTGKPVGVIMADIDFFKRINDEFGHAAGDDTLKEFTGRLKATLRVDDRLGRYGGEEFLIVTTGSTLDAVRQTAERLCRAVSASPFTIAGRSVDVTASFGISISAPHLDTAPADAGLYTAKKSGRNRVESAPVT